MSKKAVVAGHICLDITPAITGRRAEHMQDILRPGKLLTVGSADIHTGGAVANTGLAMKLLGADVTLIGKIGDDEFGDIVTNIMTKYDAKDGLIRSRGDHTSYSIVIAVPGLDRMFMHDPGANDTFCLDDLPMDKIEGAALFHFGYPPVMKRMYEDDGSELVRIMKKVKSMGTATSLDLTAVDPDTESGRADWKKILKETLPYVDIFVPSIEEIMFMICRERYEEISREAKEDDFVVHTDIERDVIPVAKQCLDMGAGTVLVKCGEKGIYYQTSDRERMAQTGANLELDISAWESKSGFVKSFVPDRVLSATGAGDTAIAAFLTSVLKGYAPDVCTKYAAATGALAVSEYDALSGIKSFEEIDKRIENGWKEN
ncbi:MAG: carbohydrate kinase family protein [Lachnospiraceae bacterium]|nr:carbohydrate kinase family protein [Lachnospiraceae bacterium]